MDTRELAKVVSQSRIGDGVRSVPPCGSGWVLTIVDCQMSIADWLVAEQTNWQSEIDNPQWIGPTRYRAVVLTSWDRPTPTTPDIIIPSSRLAIKPGQFITN